MSSNRHPAGLFLLFATEMWERFSYYGMRAILALFATKQLLLDKSFVSEQVYGSFTGLVYLTPIIGGYIADRYWGNRRSIVVGGLLMAIGNFMLFLSGHFTEPMYMYLGLGFIVFGNGFFKPNISTMVGQLYPENDKRLDSAYTIFYMGINLGAFIAPLVCGGLGESADFGWKYGFLAACIGMILGVLTFVWLRNKYLVSPEGEQLGVLPNKAKQRSDEVTSETKLSRKQINILVGVSAALFFGLWLLAGMDIPGAIIFSFGIGIPLAILADESLSKVETDRIWVIYLAAFFVIFFWSAFEQAGASLTFFADEQTDRTLGIATSEGVFYLVILAVLAGIYWILQRMLDIPREFRLIFSGIGVALLGLAIRGFVNGTPYELKEMPASWFNSFNAIFIVLFAPIMSAFWASLNARGKEPASPTKQAWGLLLLALGYLWIAWGVYGVTGKVSMLWLTVLYLLHTFGELCLSPIGLSMVNKLAPMRFASLLMGAWFLANAMANKTAGTLSALYPEEVKKEYSVTSSKFSLTRDTTTAVVSMDSTVLAALQNDSLYSATVVFANDNDPEPTAPTFVEQVIARATFAKKVEKPDSIVSVSITSAARNTVNELEYKMVKEGKGAGKVVFVGKKDQLVALAADGTVEVWNQEPTKPRFFGYEISGLVPFFLLFVGLAGTASLILFVLSPRMQRMMHGIK